MKTRLFAAGLLALVLLPGASAQKQQFIANPIFAAGEPNIAASVTADFNGEGHPDLAFGGAVNGIQLVIQLGNGDGTFTVTQTISGNLYTNGIVRGDWNGDGILDLALAISSSNSVLTYLGVGDGTFVPGGEFAVTGPGEITTADLNNDGIPDLITANGPAALGVLLGKGGDDFAPATYFPVSGPDFLVGITVGDFNRDGNVDVAATGENDWTGVSPVVIYLGRGDGTFQDPAQIVTQYSSRLVTADLNQDGIPDLATGNVSVLIGHGDGTFAPPRFYNSFVAGSFSSGTPLAVADVDGDGKLDLLAAGGPQIASAVSVLRGNGDGSFQPAALLGTTTTNLVALLVADFNGDSHTDVIAAGGPFCNLLLGRGNGKFKARRDFNILQSSRNQPQVAAVSVADVNSDSNPDVVMVDNGEDEAPRLIIMNGQKNGSFTGPKDVPLAGTLGHPNSLDTADFNGDGNPDAVVADGEQIIVLLGDGHNDFGRNANYPGSGGPQQVVAADVNGDGKPDILGANQWSNTLSVFLNDGAGLFNTRVDTPLPYVPTWIAAGDFNADGKPDVVVATFGKKDPTAFVLLGNGDGTFRLSAQLLSGGGGYSAAVGDFNSDGKLDVLVVSTNLLFYPGNGDGTFGENFVLTPGCGQSTMQVADFNRDGKLDVLRVCTVGAQLLLGRGDGSFAIGQTTEVDGGAGGLGDFNHDGALDVALGGYYVLSILLNTGAK